MSQTEVEVEQLANKQQALLQHQVWSVVATMRHPPVDIVQEILVGVMEIVNGAEENALN